MAGRVQLETVGPQDAFFTDDPEYTYFIKNFKKHSNFAPFYVDLDVTGEVEFGSIIKCTVPQNQGDLLKSVSLKVELSAIDQSLISSLHTNTTGIGYNESIGHAMIEYAELIIGGEIIQRIPSDFFSIYSENYVTQTKQHNLEKLVGKPPLEFSGTPVMKTVIGHYNGNALTDNKYFIDIPFYFYNNPELAIPVYAIKQQEIEVSIKFRNVEDCIHSIRSDIPYVNYVMYTGLKPKKLIKSAKITLEMVSLTNHEKEENLQKDYIITQVQENVFNINKNTNNDPVSYVFDLNFVNPVKELFFLIQGKRKTVNGYFTTSFDYDNSSRDLNSEYITYEQLKSLELKLDDSEILNEKTGSIINLRAVQSGIHHTRTQLFRRYYSYSFALEPERWYPTGQRNFSLVKNQTLKVNLNSEQETDRELRVLAHSYNILRVENGIAKTLFNV
jgi:hypothetical protein